MSTSSLLEVGSRVSVPFTSKRPCHNLCTPHAGISFREVPLTFIEDRPGQIAAAGRKLADQGVNIEIWLPVDTRKENFTIALGVDNAEVAQKVLGDQLTTFSYR